MISGKYTKLDKICAFRTGKLNSDAAVQNGIYPFFTCAQETYAINTAAFNTEAVILGGNNANGIFPLKYYNGAFNAYQRTYVIESKDSNIVLPRFLYFALRLSLRAFQQQSIGVATQYLTKSILDNFEIFVPDCIRPQEKIVSILASYDDLIENNRRRIKLLEESARLLYQEWFINFRFPGHEKTRFSNGLPEGWRKLTISDIADTIGGGTPSTHIHQYWEDGNVVWFVPKDLTNNRSIVLLDSERKITALGLSKSSAKMLPPETILMSSRASIGYFGIYEGACCTNQGFISCIPKLDYVRMYLLHNLMQRVNEIIGLAGGTTYKEINKTTFRAMSVILPEDKLLKTFDELAYTCLKQCRILMKQNQKLAEARDLLLPRLMSGEIEV